MMLPDISEPAAWSILFLPFGCFLLIALIIRPLLPGRYAVLSGYLAVLAIGGGFVLSLLALNTTLGHTAPVGWPAHSWVSIGSLDIRVGIIMDPLTAIMLVVVTGVSLLVQVYSQGYMRGDPGYSRYFAYMSLFTAAMIGIVLARSILQLYIFWELVGLCSYLLIGFWCARPAAASAAKKAFLITRIGDVGFLIAILYLYSHKEVFLAANLNPFEIPDIHTVATAGVLSSMATTFLALGIFAGAAGKSAQFPLHTWLPDAMEGPTPVSALIHAATMVAAGVFLVVRLFPIFEASRDAMAVVTLVGGFTVVFAASMGMVMFDIKRVLAYSTMSQLGYMMLAIGIGAPALAVFHLFTHAFFKALLFLGAGSVNHATETFDMRYMGGLRRVMPWTYATFLVGALSLAGLPPLAGFWSKDEILLAASLGDRMVYQAAFWMALLGAFMTAFYITRVVVLTFHGSYRGGGEAEGRGEVHLSSRQGATNKATNSHTSRLHGESPLVMVLPMVVLAVAAVCIGYIANPAFQLAMVPKHWLIEFLSGHAVDLSITVATYSTAIVLLGAGLALLIYQRGALYLEFMGRWVSPLRHLLLRKYYMDELYEGLVVKRFFYLGLVRFFDWMDRDVVDKAVDGVGWCSRNVGRSIARLQTGQVQGYGMGISVGILVILGAIFIWG